MHGGIPEGKAFYHVNISLRDAATNAEIKDAEVRVSIASPVAGGETKRLEPMAIRDTLSYGNYFRMPGKDPYTITVQVSRPQRVGGPRSEVRLQARLSQAAPARLRVSSLDAQTCRSGAGRKRGFRPRDVGVDERIRDAVEHGRSDGPGELAADS